MTATIDSGQAVGDWRYTCRTVGQGQWQKSASFTPCHKSISGQPNVLNDDSLDLVERNSILPSVIEPQRP